MLHSSRLRHSWRNLASELANLVARAVTSTGERAIGALAGDPLVKYNWVPIFAGPIKIWVLEDALRVNGVRVAVSAREAQEVADVLDALLTTPKVEDLIWMRAEVRLEPHPGDVVKKKPIDHSREIDRDLGDRVGLVATVGKSWVLSNRLKDGTAANYGWHGTGAKYPSQTIPGIKVWQPLGFAHNPEHRDYSQTLRLMRRACEHNGRQADLRDILRDPELAPHLSHEGPLRILRQPGVALVSSISAPTEPFAAFDTSKPLRERALAWCLAEADRWGDGIVSSTRVMQYLSGCERSGKPIGSWLAEQKRAGQNVSFCAAAQGYAERQMALPDEALPPWRAGAREIERDAIHGGRGLWISAAEARSGKIPPAGSLCIYWREPKDEGFGHVERVIEAGPDGYRSVGANEAGGRWFVDEQRVPYTHPKLLGFAVDQLHGDSSTPEDFVEPEMTDEDWKALRLEVDWDELRRERDALVKDE